MGTNAWLAISKKITDIAQQFCDSPSSLVTHRFKKNVADAEDVPGFREDINQLIVLLRNDHGVCCGCVDKGN